MKHRNLNRATCREAGYTAPSATKKQTKGGYPHKQPFNLKKGK